MVAKGKALHAPVEYFRIITTTGFATEVEHLVVVGVLRVEESGDLSPRVTVEMLKPRRGKSMRDNARSNVGQIQREPFLLKPSFGLRNLPPAKAAAAIA